jgi:hypothetical protein
MKGGISKVNPEIEAGKARLTTLLINMDVGQAIRR